MNPPTVLDLFSGAAGGWSLGLHRAGYRTVAACEIDPWRRAAFLSNFPGVEMWDDVRDVSAQSVRERLGYLPSVIVGSPPCQDASTANQGGRGIDGARTGLFFEAIRIVREVAPVWCAFENVAGLRSRGVERVLSGLEEAGYACWPLVVGAIHAGAPHKRNRVWIVAANPDVRWGGPGEAGGAGPGRLLLGAGAMCDAAADAEIGLWWPGDGEGRERGAQDGRQSRDGASAPADAAGLLGPAFARDEPDGAGDPLGHWQSWNGGPARLGRVDDGLPRGMARQCLAAFGDAVVPQITESIGRVMGDMLALRLDRTVP